MRAALTQLLLSIPALTARVEDRVHWGVLPDDVDALPCVILALMDGPADYTLDGDTGRRASVVQVDAWAASASEVAGMIDDITDAVSGLSIELAGVNLRSIMVSGSRDLDGRGIGDMAAIFGASLDLRVRWHATT